MAIPSPRARAYVEWTLRHGRLLWIVALLLAVPASLRTAQLYMHLNSDVEALLPRESASVLAIDELRGRMPGIQHLGVIVDVGDPANLPAAERMLDDLTARVRAYPPRLQRAVRTGDKVERQFLEDNAPLYVDLADLKTIRERIEARRDWEVSREQGTALDDAEPPPPLDFKDIEDKYDGRLKGGDRFPDGRFSSKKLGLTMMLIEVGEFTTGQGQSAELLHSVRADIVALGGPDRYAPGMRIGYTGDVSINVEETSALMSDLSFSTVVVVALVIVVIVTYFRWWRSVVVLLVPLLLATVYAFAIASLPPFNIRELNSNTAFLGSIIVGNGINFGIILLARYVEERRAGVGVDEALVVAVRGARLGTLSAALAASVSYAALISTEFQGFRQFGYIGGIGMILSWVVAFVLMPPLARWVDKGEKTRPRPEKSPGAITGRLARLVTSYPTPFVLLGVALTVAAAWKVRTLSGAELETDFSKLRSKKTWVSGEGYWGHRMDDLLGSYLTPTVILTDDVAHARAVAEQVREAAKRPPMSDMVASIRTIDDVLPRDQREKIDEANAIRDDLTPKIRSLLKPDKRDAVDKLLGKGDLHELKADELPDTFTTGMRERDGSLGKAVLIYPRPSKDLWRGEPLATFVRTLRAVAAVPDAPDDKPGRVAGSLALSTDILESVRRDGPIASLAAFLGVVAVVLLLFRANSTAALVIGSLLVGVLWLAGATMALGVRINFANFIAYPITFGIGVDYAVNVMSRYAQDGRTDVASALKGTGGAVALCSLTTIIGYSSLLMAENRALYLFGLVAVMGEIACLSAALAFLPAVLASRRRRLA